MNNISELMNKKEKLHKDLQSYLCFEKGIGAMSLKHPLVFQLFYSPDLNAMCNNIYKHKKECIEECIEEKNYSQLLWMYERPHRIDAFLEHIAPNLSFRTDEYWDILSSLIVDSENIWQWKSKYENLVINVDAEHARRMMDDEEREFFDNLPDEVTVYRGALEFKDGTSNIDGYSWSIARETAEFFANRFVRDGVTPVVVEGTVAKDKIRSYFSGRGENEIIADYEDVTLLKTA
ncbi:MAG TPA: hypothetical protein EYQ21_04665 [Flavobacteriales bacterium]|nr:hypothetical protein [Flavobacteriales bacterium]